MSRKLIQLTFSILLLVGMLLGFAVKDGVLAMNIEQPLNQTDPTAKFEPLVLQQLTTGPADFFVIMTEKADLSGASQLQTKAEKGQFIFDVLVKTADRTQAALRTYLDNQGVSYKSFYIANKILVKGGSLDLANVIAARPDVLAIKANHEFRLELPVLPQLTTVEPQAVEGNISFVKADQVWALGVTGEGTVLAGNDTGLDETHPAIAPHYRGCLNPPTCTNWDHNYNWWDATGTYPNNPTDGHGHGTHTTGTMVGDDLAGNQIGMAPGAQTVHCKNMTDGGSGDDGTFTECFQWDLAPWNLAGNDPDPAMAPDAINNSWGYGGGGINTFRDEILALQAAGILVEVSAGNEGPSCTTLRSPGDYQEVLTTGSVDDEGQVFPGIITNIPGYFSTSRGPSSLDGDYFPDIMAPGVNVRSCLPGNQYASWGGTSMAGPHATGLIGLMWSACPSLRGFVTQTMDMIKATAGPLTGQTGSNCGGDYNEGPNNDWGYGTIDALAAVQAAIVSCTGVGTLQGTVIDASTSLPLPGVNIEAVWDGGGTFTRVTDGNGFYTMDVPIGGYDMTATKYAYYPGFADAVMVTEGGTTVQDFALEPALSSIVDGYVTDSVTGWPLYARINIDGYPGSPVWTDPMTGYYSVSLSDGIAYTFHVTAWSGGYIQLDWTSPVLAGPLTQDFALAVDVGACNAPGYAPTTSYFEDFEASNGGFVVDPASVNSTWAWGVPTSGPGSAHSGVNVWATNLSGNYLDYSDDFLVSPNIDLSGLGSGFKLDWWQWLQTESCCDPAYVQVSNDGGVNWTTVYQAQGNIDMSWTEHSVNLDASYAVSNFQVRFYLHTDVSVTYPGWYIDDVAIYGECLPQDGGLVVGNVYDMNTGLPLPDSVVTADTGEAVTVATTPADPNVDDAFYLLWVTNENVNLKLSRPEPQTPPAGGWLTAPATDVVGNVDNEVSAPSTTPATPWVSPENILFDGGPMVTHPGGGAGGADASAVQTALGMTLYGSNVGLAYGYRIADDFVVSDAGGWQIDQLTFFAYQTGSSLSCTLNHVNYQIWNGPPNDPASSVVFGDTSTNRLVGCSWSNIYRVLDTGLTNTQRPIMAAVASAGVTLPPGTYWIDWQIGGTLASGPWQPPVTILGQTTTGNALQWNLTAWQAMTDGGTLTPQGVPFLIDGTIIFEGVPHELVATNSLYSPDTETVIVPEWGVVAQDFSLGTGHLLFDPTSIEVTLDMGASTTVNGTLANDGSGAAYFEFMEQDRGFVPTGYIEYLPMPEAVGTEGAVHNGPVNVTDATRQPYIFHGNAPQADNIIVYCDDDQHSPSYVELALQAAGLTYTFYGNPGDPGPLDLFTNEVNTLAYDLVILAQDGWIYLDAREYTAVANHIANGGSAIVYSWGIGYGSTQYGNGLWAAMGAQYQSWLNSPTNLYWWEDSHPIFTSPESVPEFTQLDNLGYLAYGAKMALLGDPSTGLGGFTTDPAANEAGVILREDFKTLYRGLTDNLNSADQDSDGTPDAEEWWINAAGFILNPAIDVPWLSEIPTSGTLAAGADTPVQVTFDAGVPEVTQPGDYLATLRIKNDTPYGPLTVPITMTVLPPASYGKLQGNVYSLGYCDGEMIPLEGAVVVISGSTGNTWTLETDENGYYQLWLDQAETPVTIDVTYEGNLPGNRTSVVIVGGQTTTEDFQLRWDQPCLSEEPASLEATLDMGATETQQLTLTNTGAGDGTFEMSDLENGYIPMQQGFLTIPDKWSMPTITPRERLAGYDPNATSTKGILTEGGVVGAKLLAPGDVLDQWPTGLTLPWGTLYDQADDSVWFSNPSYDTVDTEFTTDGSATGRSVSNAFGGSWSGDMAWNANTGTFWQVNVGGDNCIYELDPSIGPTGASICGPWTTSERGLAYDPSSDTYFVGGWNDYTVFHINSTGGLIQQWYLGLSISGLAYNFESGLLFIMENSPSDAISVFDINTGAIIGSFTVPGFGNYRGAGLEFNCDGNLWAANQGTGEAYLIDSGVPANLCGGDALWLSEDPIDGTIPGFWPLGVATPFEPAGILKAGPVPDVALTSSITGNGNPAPTAPFNPEAVLWDQPLGVNLSTYANQDFETDFDAYDMFIGDDFNNAVAWNIDTIFVPGNTWNQGGDFTCVNSLNWQIYADGGGVPDGDPWGGGNPPIWNLSLPPNDPQVTLSTGVGGYLTDVTLSLAAPINLPAGAWWLVFYPQADLSSCFQTGRHVSDTVNGSTAMVINPGGGFGFPTIWTSVQDPLTWELTEHDFAFRLEGNTGGGGGNSQVIDVTFDASAVTQPGTYMAEIMIKTNDPFNKKFVVPAVMNVNGPEDWGRIEGVVSSLGYCDLNPALAEGATVEIVGGPTLTTDANGHYSTWLEQGTYTVNVTADGHVGATATILIVAKETTVQDFGLQLIAPCMAVIPTALEATLLPDTQTTQLLHLANTGAGDASFKLLEMLGVMNLGGTAPEGASTVSAPAGYVPSLTLSKSAGNWPLGGTVAIFKDANPWGGVATETILAANGIPYEVHTSAEFGTLDFTNYGMIVFSGDQPTSFYDAYGSYITKFEEYVEQGGFLNFFACDAGWNGGTLTDPLPAGMTWTGWIYENYNNIDDPAHPVMVGVPNPFYGNYASHGNFTNLPAEAHVIASEQTGGIPTIVEYPIGAGWVIAFGQPLEISYDWGWDAGIIFGNTLLWGSTFEPALEIPWLSEDPTEGTVAADTTMDVAVTFDATGLTEGDYVGTLRVKTGDPNNATVNIPVTLHVVTQIAPVAHFTASHVVVGHTTVFTFDGNVGVPPAGEYNWDFGDESTHSGTTPDPVFHSYKTAGTYTVTLEVCNVAGCDIYIGENVAVVDPLQLFLPLINK